MCKIQFKYIKQWRLIRDDFLWFKSDWRHLVDRNTIILDGLKLI